MSDGNRDLDGGARTDGLKEAVLPLKPAIGRREKGTVVCATHSYTSEAQAPAKA